MILKMIGTLVLTAFLITSNVLPTEAKSLPMRTLNVGVAVSPSFKAIPGWKDKFKKRLAYASLIFEREFKIKLQATAFWDWKIGKDDRDSHELLDDLANSFPLHGVDIVVGLTKLEKLPSLDKLKDLHVIGRARPLSGYLVIRYPNDPLFRIQEETVLVHELGHLFGAVHIDDPESIMSPIVDRQIPTRFDNTNRDIVSMTRDLDFKKGIGILDARTSQHLLGSYLKLMTTNQPLEFYYSLGILYLNLGKIQEAVKAWERAASLEGDNPQIYLDLGILYSKSGDYQKAITALNTAVSGFNSPNQQTRKATALNALCEAYLKDGDVMSAYNAISRAAAIQPDNLNVKLNQALVQLKQGQVGQAIKRFEDLLSIDGSNEKILAYLGSAYAQTGKYDTALNYLKRALGINTKKSGRTEQNLQVEILNELGSVCQKMKREDEAIYYFQNACTIIDSAACHKRLGDIYFQRGRWDDAIRELMFVIQSQRDNADAYGALGVAMSQVGRDREALSVFQEGLRYARDNETTARLHNNVGYMYLQLKHPELAEKEFRFAIAKNWQSADAHIGLAMVDLNRSNFIGARQSLENVLRVNPNNAKARKLLTQVNETLSKASAGK